MSKKTFSNDNVPRDGVQGGFRVRCPPEESSSRDQTVSANFPSHSSSGGRGALVRPRLHSGTNVYSGSSGHHHLRCCLNERGTSKGFRNSSQHPAIGHLLPPDGFLHDSDLNPTTTGARLYCCDSKTSTTATSRDV